MKKAQRNNLWEHSHGQRLRYALAMLVMAVGIGLSFLIPLVSKAAIDGPLQAAVADNWLQELGASLDLGRVGQLWLAGALILQLALISGLCMYLRGRWSARASEGIVKSLRDKLYSHLGNLPCAYFDASDTGDLVQRCTSDVETLRMFLATQVVEIARAALLVSISTPILFHLHVPLAWIAIALLPVIVIYAVYFFRRIKVLFQLMDEAEGRMTTVLQENLTAIRVVRAFARQDFEKSKFGACNAEFRDHHFRFMQFLGAYWSSSDLLCLSQIGMVLLGGANFVAEGALTVGTLAAFLEFQFLIIWPIRQMGRVLSDSGKAIVSLRRLREVLDQPEEDHLDALPGESLPAIEGSIEVRDLDFAFGAEAPTLRGISFSLKAGQSLALIGPPGAGKTTLIQLLLRLYDYQTGSIRIDGHELRELPRRHVRAHFGIVLQEPFLYSKSVRANLQLGSLDASEEALYESTMAAAVHDSILEFAEGYETLVGERGVTLSGGQRQRIALARALLADPAILVLDDALSAVDTETETRILEALASRQGERTTIIIAHRLSSVVHADLTLVLDKGRILQAGNHEQLIAEDGPYRNLWQIQGALETEIAAELAHASHDTQEQ